MMVKYTRYPIQIHNVIDVKFTDGRNVISILLYSHYLLIVFIFQLNAKRSINTRNQISTTYYNMSNFLQ